MNAHPPVITCRCPAECPIPHNVWLAAKAADTEPGQQSLTCTTCDGPMHPAAVEGTNFTTHPGCTSPAGRRSR